MYVHFGAFIPNFAPKFESQDTLRGQNLLSAVTRILYFEEADLTPNCVGKYMSEQDMLNHSAKFAPYRSVFMWYMWRVEDIDINVVEGA